MIDELDRLAKLWRDGALTDEEFAQQKQRLFAAQEAGLDTTSASASDGDDLSFDDLEAAPVEAIDADLNADQMPDSISDAEDDELFDSVPGDADRPAEVLFDDADAEAATDAPTNDPMSLDDLNAMLDDALDSAALSEVQSTSSMLGDGMDAESLIEPAIADEPGAESAGAASEPAPLSFDELDAMLDVELANLASTSEDIALRDEPGPGGASGGEDDVIEDAGPQGIDGGAEPVVVDFSYDDIDTLIAVETPDERTQASGAERPPSGSKLEAEPRPGGSLVDELSADLDFEFDTPEPGPEDVSAEAAPPAAGAPLPVPATPLEPAPEGKPRRKRQLPLRGVLRAVSAIAAKLPVGRLPKPVQLGLGGVGLFAAAMVLGVVLAKSMAPKVPEPPKEGHGKETTAHAEPPAAPPHVAEPAAASAQHEDDAGHEAANEAAPPHDQLPAPPALSEATLTYDPREVSHYCSAINAMTQGFATAVSATQHVPVKDVHLVAGSGYLGETADAPGSQSCQIKVDTPSGRRACTAEGLVRFPDGTTGAYPGKGKRAVKCTIVSALVPAGNPDTRVVK